MRIQLYTTDDVFSLLEAEWDSTLDANRADHFFMRRDWQQIWWKYLGRGDLAVITIREEDGTLRGIAPFFRVDDNGQNVLHLIGCVDVTDYVDLIYSSDDSEKVIKAVLDYLCTSSEVPWDVIHLCNVIESSPTLTVFPELARTMGLAVTTGDEDVCPVIELPADYETYLESLDKKQRHELRRKRRRAEENGVSWYLVSPEHNIEEEIERFLELMARSTSEKTSFLEIPGHRGFFKEIGQRMFAQGLLDLTFLTVNNQRAAAMWNFVYKGRMMLYNSGLNPVDYASLSPGIVLLTYNIEHTITSGCNMYDFLQGDEEYKFRMGATPIKVKYIQVTR